MEILGLAFAGTATQERAAMARFAAETRERRLAALIADSRAGVKVKPLRWGA